MSISGKGSRRIFTNRLLALMDSATAGNAESQSLTSMMQALHPATAVTATDSFPFLDLTTGRRATAAILRTYVLGISGTDANIPEATRFHSKVGVGFSGAISDSVDLDIVKRFGVRPSAAVAYPTTMANNFPAWFYTVQDATEVLGFAISRVGNHEFASDISFYKTRAVDGTRAAIADGDKVGMLGWQGATATNGIVRMSASILGVVNGAVSSGTLPVDLVIALSPTVNCFNGAGERWRFTSAGMFQPGTSNAYDIGTAALRLRMLYTVGLNASGDVTLGDAATDTITATGRFASDLTPSATNARDLGATALRWRTGYFATSIVTPKISNAAVPNAALVGSGGMTVTGTTAGYTITAGVSPAWGQQVYSTSSFSGVALATATAAQNNLRMMFGLSTNPTASASYTNLAYAIYCNNLGVVEVYQNGVPQGSFGAYVAGDIFTVEYTGSAIEFAKNGVVFRTVAVAAGLTFFFDSSYFDTGASLTSVTFSDPVGGVSGAVTIDTDLVPDATNSHDLGETALRFKDGWFAGMLTAATLDISGDAVLAGTLTIAGGVVSYGAPDSGGLGFRQVLVPN